LPTGEISQLQQQLEGRSPEQEFRTAQVANQAIVSQGIEQQMQTMTAAMSTQAEQLMVVWQPPVMTERVGTNEKDKKSEANKEQAGKKNQSISKENSNATPSEVLIKSGTILFAVLDTDANSDYPDSPILATIVEGKLKGAKLCLILL
jgi:type IV secretory pathway VirB10-like protein